MEPISADFVAAFKQVRDTAQSQTLKYRIGASSKWGALSPLVEQPWVVAVAIPEDEILLPIREALKRVLLVGFAITLGVFLLALALGRSLLRPIHRLSDAMADALQSHQEHLEDLVKARTQELEHSLAEVQTLQGVIPICSYCKQIRDEEGGWWQMERYISDHSEAAFSHGICPECRAREFPNFKGHSNQS